MNPFAAPPLCSSCNDIRYVTKNVAARQESGHVIPCPRCGPDTEEVGGKTKETQTSRERYEHFRATRWQESQQPPGITQMDLTPEEEATYQLFKRDHPKVANKTILTWIEGQRYNPAEDVEFLEDARAKFKEWRAR